jgi:hypothetical protein
MNMKNTCRRFFLATTLAAALTIPIAQGETIWNNAAGDNDFANPDNWVGGVAPLGTNTGQVLINIGGGSDIANRAIYSQTVGTGDFERLSLGISSTTPAQFDITGGTFKGVSTGGAGNRIASGGSQGTVNQSGTNTVVAFGGYVRIGLDPNSVGIYNLSGGSFHSFRSSTAVTPGFTSSLVLGSGAAPTGTNQAATGTMNITGGSFLTRNGVYLGAGGGQGTFHVAGSAPTSIRIGGDGNNEDGGWYQNTGSTLLIGIDGTVLGVRAIEVIDVEGNAGLGGNVTFASGSLLDVGFLGAANYSTFTVMTWDGSVTNHGLQFANTVDTNIWSFSVNDNSLTVTAVPEPGSALLFLGGMAGLWLLRRRSRRKVENC